LSLLLRHRNLVQRGPQAGYNAIRLVVRPECMRTADAFDIHRAERFENDDMEVPDLNLVTPMLSDEPRLFFMHFRANAQPGEVVSGPGSALDKVAVPSR